MLSDSEAEAWPSTPKRQKRVNITGPVDSPPVLHSPQHGATPSRPIYSPTVRRLKRLKSLNAREMPPGTCPDGPFAFVRETSPPSSSVFSEARRRSLNRSSFGAQSCEDLYLLPPWHKRSMVTQGTPPPLNATRLTTTGPGTVCPVRAWTAHQRWAGRETNARCNARCARFGAHCFMNTPFFHLVTTSLSHKHK